MSVFVFRIIVSKVRITTNVGYGEISSAKTVDDGARRGL